MSQEHFLSIARRLLERDGEAIEGLSADSDYFYAGAQRQHQLETIRHLACFGDLLLFLEAELGAGKSTLLRKVSAELRSELQVIYIQIDDESTPVSVVQEIANKSSIFAAPSEDMLSLLERCKASYESLYSQKSKRTLLIIDDAHRAEPGLIKSILAALALPQPDSPVVLLVSSTKGMGELVGDYKPEELHVLSLSKLKRGELGEYIQHGLKSVGYAKGLQLTDARLDALFLRSGGLLKNVETYMGSAIFGDDAGRPMEPATKLPTRVPVAALATIVVVLLASFLFVAQQHNLFSGLIDVESEGDDMLAQRLAQQERIAMLDKALEQSNKFDEPGDVTVAVSEDALLDVVSDNSLSMKEVESGGSPALADSSEVSSAAASDKAIEVPLPEPEPEVEAQVKTELAKKDHVKKISTSLAGSDEPKEAVKKVSVTKEGKRHPAFRDVFWVESQSKDSHTFQVLGSYNESTATRFVEQVGLQDLYYVQSSYKGKPWFVVLYGVFPDITAARRAGMALPLRVAREKPWIRSISGLK